MINQELQWPFFAKASIFFIGLVALLAILYIAQGIIVPFVFSIIIAILLHPLVNFLVKKKVNRVLAIVISLLITFLFIVGFISLLFSEASRFSESWPILVEKFTDIVNQFISGGSSYFDINPQAIHDWITKTQGELINTSTAAIGKTLVTVGTAIMIILLLPLYIFLLLYYQPIILEFIHRLFQTSNQSQVNKIVTQTKTVVQRYLTGLIIEAVLIATMEIITLLILGVDYAILLGILGAILNMIPYIGGIIAVALPMMVAIVTKSSGWTAIYILIIYYIIQLIDNNFIVPKIVASKVKINALFSILAVFIGNALWGIPGMFLSIPLLAIIKLICDNIEPLKPWGFLLGDTMPSILSIKPIIKKIESKISTNIATNEK
jgi:predicted PurR-regulated permease PerM